MQNQVQKTETAIARHCGMSSRACRGTQSFVTLSEAKGLKTDECLLNRRIFVSMTKSAMTIKWMFIAAFLILNSTFLILNSQQALAQAPNKMSYQSVIRNSSGT